MAAQITLEDVKPLMAELGFTVPDTVLQLLLDQVSAASVCMDGAGYAESLQKLLLIYAAARLAALSGARKIASQSAPSGASRSFTYDSSGTDHLYRQILAWDTNGCLGGLPISGVSVGFFDVVRGC
ncbi:hypothetical protein CYR55_05395 [Chimaeribacter californicus]|uniref:DUF4054 domain-containing protein n=1 Tax=Chimaeribacter californicus TaxID=2060067 RepID=A0A2N5EDY7_9GAMM|nr:hypothetical protein [Chimaeribacter californicus]PLR40716.1 hypothetical protein CYR55_05395 [Chimaeribacter californicus]